jgi:peptidoglycan/xylan/chitin deacetylase (PgdA/CDA1 family)
MNETFQKVIGLKIDVDTFKGMKEGVPTLLSLLKKYGIRASFFVPMGRDHTGWTVKRVFTRKGFLKKASRVGVLETYGIRTLMHGLLLPGPEIAMKNKQTLREVLSEGHEAGIHGYDHVSWHDHVKGWDDKKTTGILSRACRVYEDILGQKVQSFASPGWMINAHALRFLENRGFLYSSDTRGISPFLPVMGGDQLNILQIPTTLPTLDEVVGLAGYDPIALARYFIGKLTEGLNILTVHTELEGRRWTAFLEAFIARTLDQGFVYSRLIYIALTFRESDGIPRCNILYGQVEGRAGEVSLQNVADDS